MALIQASRRGFLAGIGVLLAAPAIVQVSSLMPLRGVPLMSVGRTNSLLTIDMITREAVKLFTDSNVLLRSLDEQYDEEFAIDGAKIGSTLRIRLPNDYVVTRSIVVEDLAGVVALPELPLPVALVGAAAVAMKDNPVVSRRFWSGW